MSKNELFKFFPHVLVGSLGSQANCQARSNEVPFVRSFRVNNPTLFSSDCQNIDRASAEQTEKCWEAKSPVW